MPTAQARVYCSGPLFNDKEREEMQEIAATLEAAGVATFLPQRDGFEFKPLLPVLLGLGVAPEKAHALWDRAIFALDVYQATAGCEAMIVNLNGRVPDEGAVAEAALAWSAGGIVIGYKSDVRSLFAGKDNAMVAGLFGFRLHGGIRAAVAALQNELVKGSARPSNEVGGPLRETIELGRRLWEAAKESDDLSAVSALLV